MEIAIIGGGISGLYLAWQLAKRGKKVTVFEKRNFLGKEVCSGLFSERILEFVPESKNLIEGEIDFFLIHFPKKTLKIKPKNKFFYIDHSKLDEVVASLAKKNGVRIFFGKEIKNEKFKILIKEFERIIGCDGSLSETRKFLKLPSPKFYMGIQGFYRKKVFFSNLKKESKILAETWPTKNGFIWKIERKDIIEYGIIEKPENANKFFDSFLKKNNFEINYKKSALIPQGLIIPQNEKMTLLGDAAGLTKPWSGGGVVWSLTAADILLKNFPNFLKYRREVKKFFMPQIIFSKMLKPLFYFLGFNFPFFLPKNFEIDGDFLI